MLRINYQSYNFLAELATLYRIKCKLVVVVPVFTSPLILLPPPAQTSYLSGFEG